MTSGRAMLVTAPPLRPVRGGGLNKHHLTYRKNRGTDEKKNLILVHADCHQMHHAKIDRYPTMQVL
ncbi:HNH endonuclease [Streptomyces sp. NPDC054766]